MHGPVKNVSYGVRWRQTCEAAGSFEVAGELRVFAIQWDADGGLASFKQASVKDFLSQ